MVGQGLYLKPKLSQRFNILKKPFVEGIPRYSTEEGWTWSKLSEGTSGKDKEELDALAKLLDSYAKWTPYPIKLSRSNIGKMENT